MGRLKRRIAQLEQAASGLTTRAILEDGTVIHIREGERLDAFIALIDEEPHPLHDLLKRLAPREKQEDQTINDFANILWALEPAVREEGLEGES